MRINFLFIFTLIIAFEAILIVRSPDNRPKLKHFFYCGFCSETKKQTIRFHFGFGEFRSSSPPGGQTNGEQNAFILRHSFTFYFYLSHVLDSLPMHWNKIEYHRRLHRNSLQSLNSQRKHKYKYVNTSICAVFCNAHSTHGTRWMNKSLCIVWRTIYLQINPSMTLHPIIALAFDWITTEWAGSVSASRSKHYYLWILWFTDVYMQIITHITTTFYCVCRAHSCLRRAFSSRQGKLLLNEISRCDGWRRTARRNSFSIYIKQI